MRKEKTYLFDINFQIWKVFKKQVFTYTYNVERNVVM